MRLQAIWPALARHAWSRQAGKLIAALHAKLRAHSLQLLSRSYSTISPAKAATLLGASEAELPPREPLSPPVITWLLSHLNIVTACVSNP